MDVDDAISNTIVKSQIVEEDDQNTIPNPSKKACAYLEKDLKSKT